MLRVGLAPRPTELDQELFESLFVIGKPDLTGSGSLPATECIEDQQRLVRRSARSIRVLANTSDPL